jgi:hypothetical protein
MDVEKTLAVEHVPRWRGARLLLAMTPAHALEAGDLLAELSR